MEALMSAEEKIHTLTLLLMKLYGAGIMMPRHTPEAGEAGTEHQYTLCAADVWAFDQAMKEAAAEINFTDMPADCCIGNPEYNPEMASALKEVFEKRSGLVEVS